MRIARLDRPGRFTLADEDEPPIGPDEVRVRVAACGVCASELDIYDGAAGHATYPWYPGHEVSGTVEETGPDVKALRPGDGVAAWVTTRGFAETVAVKEAYCEPADGVPLDVALAEPLACAVNAVELAAPALGDDVVVIGAGFMGLLITRLLALGGPRSLVVADVRSEALERAAAAGATATVDVSSTSLAEAVMRETGDAGADVTIEATGSQRALDEVGDVTRMSGTIAIAGYHQGAPRQIPLAHWNWMAFRIANAHFRDPAVIMHGLRTAMRLLASRAIELDDLVTHRFDLDRIDEAFRTAIDKPDGFVKATVIP
ncbi:MAG TPA: alcohol dehydrogenase catalytic domain-containing protein [Actinomycetota bacterium]|nr:alcohol dehydrogenase catalytic domain-containing protein [Actinomycetota bacterium]